MVSMLGMCLVSYSPGKHEAQGGVGESVAASQAAAVAASTALAGDLLAVMSAAASGVYMVLLRVCVPNEEDVHMPSLFGMIGFVSTICFVPLFPILHLCGVEARAPPVTDVT